MMSTISSASSNASTRNSNLKKAVKKVGKKKKKVLKTEDVDTTSIAADDDRNSLSPVAPTTPLDGENDNVPTQSSTTVLNEPPPRPLSAYNLFVRMERQRILREDDDENGSQGSADASAPYTVEEVSNFLEMEQLKQKEMVGAPKPPPRKHTKSHGKIGFAELARRAAKRWKEMPDSERCIFRNLASEQLRQYKQELEQWTTHVAAEDKNSTTTASTDVIKNLGKGYLADTIPESPNGVKRNEPRKLTEALFVPDAVESPAESDLENTNHPQTTNDEDNDEDNDEENEDDMGEVEEEVIEEEEEEEVIEEEEEEEVEESNQHRSSPTDQSEKSDDDVVAEQLMIFSKQKGAQELHIRNCEINSNCPSLPSTTSTLGTATERQSKSRKRDYPEDENDHFNNTSIGMERLQQQLLELQEQLQTQKKVIEELQQQQQRQQQLQQQQHHQDDLHQQSQPTKTHHLPSSNQYIQQLQQERTENNSYPTRRSSIPEPKQAPSLCRMILPPAGERVKPSAHSQRFGTGTSPSNSMSKDFLAGMRMGSQISAKRSAAAAIASDLAYADQRYASLSTVDPHGSLNNPVNPEAYDSFEDSPNVDRAYHQDNQLSQEITMRENMMRRMNSQMDLFWENQKQHLPQEQAKFQNYQYQHNHHQQQSQQPPRFGNDGSNYEAYKQSLFSQMNMTSRMMQEQTARQQQQQQQQNHLFNTGPKTAEPQQSRLHHTQESPSNSKKQAPLQHADSQERPAKKMQKSESGRHRSSKMNVMHQGNNNPPASSNSHLRHPIVEP